jgi:hypothetical protein
MKYELQEGFFLDCLEELLKTPSPVGYDVAMKPVLERYAAEFGQKVWYDNKGTAYITLEGLDNSKTVMVSTHLDTLGLVVRRIEPDGTILVRNMGALNFHSAEGETVTIFTRDGRSYTGLLTVCSHSIHVFDDCREMPRDEHHMMVLLDERVCCKADVSRLGIRNGDLTDSRWNTLGETLTEAPSYRELWESLRRVSMGMGALVARIESRGAERRMARDLASSPDIQLAALRASVYEDMDWGESVVTVLEPALRREHKDAVRRWQETCELADRRAEAYAAYSTAWDAYLSEESAGKQV